MSAHAENLMRDQIAMHGESLHSRGLVPGSSGNISAFLDDGLLVTPTNSCLGRLDPARIAKLDWQGNHLSGDKPSKEAFLHNLMYVPPMLLQFPVVKNWILVTPYHHSHRITL